MTYISQSIPKIKQLVPGRAKLVSWLKTGTFLGVVFLCLYAIGQFLPVGYDWQNYFSKGILPSIWTPWTKPVLWMLNLPTVFALSIMAFGIRAYRYKASPLALALGILSLPTMWVFFLGNLEGITLLGLILMPWGAPLALMKPQITAFALLAKRRWLLAGAAWILLSLLIWGLWPLNLLSVLTPEWDARWLQDISLFPWGLLITLPLLWLSRGDEDLMMAAGSFGTPHLFPYHFFFLMPALGRMRWPWMVATWLVSWTPLLAERLGPFAWHFGNLMSVLFWLGVYLNRNPVNGTRLSKLFQSRTSG